MTSDGIVKFKVKIDDASRLFVRYETYSRVHGGKGFAFLAANASFIA